MSFFKAVLSLALLTLCSSVNAERWVIYCGLLINGLSQQAKVNMSILGEDKKITRIVADFVDVEDDTTVIDLRNHTVMPGLIDLHVHLEGETSKDAYLQGFITNDADRAFDSTLYAKRTLLAGFTTVRDLGGSGVNSALRNAINRGSVIGPRIYSAGKSIATTGGHADPTNGYRNDLKGDPGPKEGVINGADDARKAVRQRYKDGSDVIKITATGGVLSVAKDGSGPQFTDEELAAIITTAREYGLPTAAHAHGAEGMKRAVAAGIGSIEHGTYLNSEIISLMKKKGTYLVPTLSAGRFVAEKAKTEGYYPPMVAKKALVIGNEMKAMFERAYNGKVNIAFGTDAGVFPHGENAKEFEYMMEAGMPAMEAIQSATSVAAIVLRAQDTLGSIQAGKSADIIAVIENPLKNIKALQSMDFVMKEGVIYKRDGKQVNP